MSLSAPDEQTRHADANWGPRSVVLAIQTHSDGVRRRAGWQPDPGRARLSRPAAAQTALGRVQASYPLLSQVKLTSLRPALHLSILTAMSTISGLYKYGVVYKSSEKQFFDLCRLISIWHIQTNENV